MGIPNRQIGWSDKTNMLWNIAKELSALTCDVACDLNGCTSSSLMMSKLIGSAITTTGNINFSSISAAEACTTWQTVKATDVFTGWSEWNIKYSSLTLGKKVYEDVESPDCVFAPTGYFWYQPNVDDSTFSYFTDPALTQITIVTISDVGGESIITAIDTCTV